MWHTWTHRQSWRFWLNDPSVSSVGAPLYIRSHGASICVTSFWFLLCFPWLLLVFLLFVMLLLLLWPRNLLTSWVLVYEIVCFVQCAAMCSCRYTFIHKRENCCYWNNMGGNVIYGFAHSNGWHAIPYSYTCYIQLIWYGTYPMHVRMITNLRQHSM